MSCPSSIRRRAAGFAVAVACLPGFATANPAEARRLLDRGDHEEARERYRSLADQARTDGRRAAFRLGEGLAAYRGGDFRGARAGFSGALLGPDSQVRRNGHLGMGNSLFQLGWESLAESPYPGDPEAAPDLDAFDAVVRERLSRMLDSPEPEEGETEGFARIRDTILNWSDAVRHYQSALDIDPGDESALANRRTTLTFLERLRDLLEEERDETEQSIPEPSPGEGEQPQPQPGEGEPGEGDPDEEPGNGEEQDMENGEGDPSDDADPSGRDGDPDADAPDVEGDPGEQEPEPGDAEDAGEIDPDETPEERARRILSENADVETGPLNPGRREFIPPEKDW